MSQGDDKERKVNYRSALEERSQQDLDYYDGSIEGAYSDPDNDVDEYNAWKIFSDPEDE